MKIPCVRCGKDIEAPNVYCRDCERVMSGEGPSVQPLPSPDHSTIPGSKRKSKFPSRFIGISLLLLICIAASVFFLKKDIDETPLVPTATEQPAEVDVFAGSAQDTQAEVAVPHTSDKTFEPDLSVPAEAPFQTQNQQEHTVTPAERGGEPHLQGLEIVEFNSTASDVPGLGDSGLAGNLTEPLPLPAELTEEQPPAEESALPPGTTPADEGTPLSSLDAASLPETSPDAAPEDSTAAEPADQEQPDANATISVAAAPEPETPDSAEDGIWVFHLGQNGLDIEIAEHLRGKGYANVTSKGKWPGHFNDKNVFHRHEDDKGLDKLMNSLPADDFFHYYYDNERIGTSVKNIFRDNADVNFLIIAK